MCPTPLLSTARRSFAVVRSVRKTLLALPLPLPVPVQATVPAAMPVWYFDNDGTPQYANASDMATLWEKLQLATPAPPPLASEVLHLQQQDAATTAVPTTTEGLRRI